MKNRFNVLLRVVVLCFVYGVNVPVALSWDPLTDAGANLIGWYDASDGATVLTSGTTITNWLDKSGNGYDLDTGSDRRYFNGLPLINGLTAVKYEYIGYIQRTGMPDIDLANGVCIITVGKGVDGDTHHYGSTSSTNGSSSIYFYESGSGTMNAVVKVNGLGNNFTFTSSSYIDGVPFMCAVYYDPAGMAYLRGNGGANTASSARDSGATFTINAIKNGRLGNTAGHYHGEMIILNTVDIGTIEKVEGYLAHKWSLYSSLPTNHPYRYHEPDAPIPFGALSVSNITTTSADLYVEAETNLTSATLVWDTSDKGKTNVLAWAGTSSASGSTPGTITGVASGLTEDTWYFARFYGADATTNGWSIPYQFATSLTANQTPLFSNVYPSSSKVYLYWFDNANTETAYVLQRATSSGGPYSDLVTLATDTTTYADTTVSAGTTYFYRLLATNNISMTATDPSACQISTTTLTDGPSVTISATAPTTNEADIAVLSGTTDATGDKCWTDSSGHGQTFLSSSKGGKLKAITYQSKTTFIFPKIWGVRVGKMDASTFNGIYWDSCTQTNSATVADMYMTVTFPTPIDLEPDTLYGVDLQMDSDSGTGFGTGIPYLHYIKSNVYAYGQRYTMVRGYSTTVSLANNDRIFHMDIDFPPPAGTLMLFK